jgi:uncharacterized protein
MSEPPDTVIPKEDNAEARPRPVQPSERYAILDVLRGVAIFAILVVNIHYYGGPIFTALNLQAATGSPVDRIVTTCTLVFVSEKFFSILSILFGIGMGIIFTRTTAKSGRFWAIYTRRLVGLFVIGISHALLLYAGDFIGNYAILSILLILFRNARPKLILTASLVVLLIPVILALPSVVSQRQEMNTMTQSQEEPERRAQQRHERYRRIEERSVAVYGHGTLPEIFRYRLREIQLQYMGLLFFGNKIFSMFLLGLWCWKTGLVRSLPESYDLLRKLAWTCGPLGITLSLLNLLEQLSVAGDFLSMRLLFLLSQQLGPPLLGIFYIVCIMLLFSTGFRRYLTVTFSAVGRMAMSNYLLQSIVATTLFYSYGLGLYHRTSTVVDLALVVAIFAAQVVISNTWLRRFNFGPLEWLLRAFAYLRLPKMRPGQGRS